MKYMDRYFYALLSILIFLILPANFANADDHQKIIEDMETHATTMKTVREVVSFGSRMVGSDGLKKAIEWAQKKMKDMGLENVHTESVMAPLWERGAVERMIMTQFDKDGQTPIHKSELDCDGVTALGNSVGTPSEGIEGEVIEVSSVDEVAKMASGSLEGKIVFYNGAMNPSGDPLVEYGKAASQRVIGPVIASEKGATGVLVRSLTLLSDDTAHTGVTMYKEGVPKIPAAAISIRHANDLSQEIKASQTSTHIRLILSASQKGTTETFNVMGEVRGSEKPDEYVVVGGHLDSWDLSHSAQDDAVGVAQALEVVRVFKSLKIVSKRTLRIVLFSAEEFGGIGGIQYAKNVKANNEKHIAAIESDLGAGSPKSLDIESDEQTTNKMKMLQRYFDPFGPNFISKGYSGADVSCLVQAGVCPAFAIGPDSSHYFDVHHSANDTIDRINEKSLDKGASVLAVWAYVMSNIWKSE